MVAENTVSGDNRRYSRVVLVRDWERTPLTIRAAVLHDGTESVIAQLLALVFLRSLGRNRFNASTRFPPFRRFQCRCVIVRIFQSSR